MNNPRITKKEHGLLKGAIRRVFSRSELRQRAVNKTRIEHIDLKRPRVKKWSLCPICLKPTPTYKIQVDHVFPIIPYDTTFAEMSLDVVVDRVWCIEDNLQGICIECHLQKTKNERKIRKQGKIKK